MNKLKTNINGSEQNPKVSSLLTGHRPYLAIAPHYLLNVPFMKKKHEIVLYLRKLCYICFIY